MVAGHRRAGRPDLPARPVGRVYEETGYGLVGIASREPLRRRQRPVHPRPGGRRPNTVRFPTPSRPRRRPQVSVGMTAVPAPRRDAGDRATRRRRRSSPTSPARPRTRRTCERLGGAPPTSRLAPAAPATSRRGGRASRCLAAAGQALGRLDSTPSAARPSDRRQALARDRAGRGRRRGLRERRADDTRSASTCATSSPSPA